MKRAVSVLLLLVTVLSLFSCDRKYDEGEVLAEAKRLIALSEIYNDILWGEGIDYVEDLNHSNGYYYPASSVHLSDLGFETIDELKEKIRSVYSSDYCSSIFKTVFLSVGSDSGITSMVRYYQKYADAQGKVPEYIMVYSKAEKLLSDKVNYLYDTLKCVGSEDEVVYVTVKVNITREDKNQTREIKIGLIEEENGWRIHTPTYVSFIDSEYEDLQNRI